MHSVDGTACVCLLLGSFIFVVCVIFQGVQGLSGLPGPRGKPGTQVSFYLILLDFYRNQKNKCYSQTAIIIVSPQNSKNSN